MRTLLAVSLVATIAAAANPARACGGFFSSTENADVVAMSDIRVLFVSSAGHVDQYVQIAYSGAATRFAWVYPVPANPEVAEDRSVSFATLDELTRPKITVRTNYGSHGSSGGFGCGGAASADKGGLDEHVVPPTVRVWQTGQVGVFDYAVITATRIDDMVGWLNTNGFAAPAPAAAVLDHYVQQGWFFVAMKVSVAKQVSGDVPSTTVVRLGYAASDVRYPLRMASLSASKETSIEIYVLSTEPLAPVAPFVAVQVQPSALHALSPTTHNYDQVFAGLLTSNGPRALVREYQQLVSAAGVVSGFPATRGYLTRLRTVLTASGMDQDLRFDYDPSAPTIDPVYQLEYPVPQALRSAFPPALLAMAGLWLLRRSLRRRS
jgi:hypothetical protein